MEEGRSDLLNPEVLIFSIAYLGIFLIRYKKWNLTEPFSLYVMELVTPSNSLSMMRASLENGSDAVYVPMTGYLAIRLGKEFFGLDELEGLVKEVHGQGKLIYPVINGGVREGEQERYYRAAERILDSGADGVVVGTPAMVQWFNRNRTNNNFKIIASSTMAVINPDDARFYAGLGVDRVILSRMHRVCEVEEFCRLPGIEIEIFVHGVVCPCWEGQTCLLPQLIFQEQYDGITCLVKDGSSKTPACITQRWWELEIQCDLDYLDRYRKMKVDSIKVIPVAKSPEDSGQIVKLWRKAVNAGNSQDYRKQKEAVKKISPLPVDFNMRDF